MHRAGAAGGKLPRDRCDHRRVPCGRRRPLHPGYGFLSENAEFAERLRAAGIAFIGPDSAHIRLFGLKHTARDAALKSGIKLLPGSELLVDRAAALCAAERIGYPLMLKSTAGGGGIGMQLCADRAAPAARFDTVARLAAGHFGDARLYIERYVAASRHIEVQIFGDGCGRPRSISSPMRVRGRQ
jgi:urea carboxylase